MLLYMIVVAASQVVLNLDAVDTGRVASLVSALVGGIITLMSWRYFTERPGVVLFTRKRKLVTIRLRQHQRDHIRIVRRSPRPTEVPRVVRVLRGGHRRVVGLVAIYLIEQLEMCGYVAVLVCAIVFTVPGAALSSKAAQGGRAKIVHAGCLLFLSLVIFCVPFVIYKPSHAKGGLPWPLLFYLVWGSVPLPGATERVFCIGTGRHGGPRPGHLQLLRCFIKLDAFVVVRGDLSGDR